MSEIVNYLIGLPFSIRVAIGVFLIVFIVWYLGRKIILRILSIIPFLVKKLFIGFYLFIDTILSALHKKVGWIFIVADERFGEVCEKIDCKIGKWHTKWRNAQKAKIKECFLVYIISCLIIIVPSYVATNNKIIKAGENTYLMLEEFVMKYIKESKWYDSQKKFPVKENWIEATNKINVEGSSFETTLIVAGLKSSLLVRDIPSRENSITLDKLYNDDFVTWNGEIAFSYVNNEIIMWAKITLENGIMGWSRMDYLYPLEYENMTYYVTESREMRK